VIEALATFGFVAYALEEMSFSEQVRLFSQAEMVVTSRCWADKHAFFPEPCRIGLFSSYVPGYALANLSRVRFPAVP